MEILQRMYGSLTVLPQAVLSILEPRYLFRNCLHAAKNLICLLARQAFSSFRLKPYLSLFVRYLNLFANEADCKQWRETRFASKIELLQRCFNPYLMNHYNGKFSYQKSNQEEKLSCQNVPMSFWKTVMKTRVSTGWRSFVIATESEEQSKQSSR